MKKFSQSGLILHSYDIVISFLFRFNTPNAALLILFYDFPSPRIFTFSIFMATLSRCSFVSHFSFSLYSPFISFRSILYVLPYSKCHAVFHQAFPHLHCSSHYFTLSSLLCCLLFFFPSLSLPALVAPLCARFLSFPSITTSLHLPSCLSVIASSLIPFP